MPYSLKPICMLRNILRPHSLILLQECYSNVLYDEIQHEFPEYHITKGSMTRYALVNSGLVILSIYPIIEHIFIPFDVQDYLSTDVLSEKGFLVVKLQIKHQIIYIINTHLQSTTKNDINSISIHQLQQLVAFVDTLDYPFIIGGDFNIDITKLPLSISKALTLYSPNTPTIYIEYDILGNELNTSSVPIKHYLPFIYDFFMTKGISLKQPVVLHFEYSDHAPVHSSILI